MAEIRSGAATGSGVGLFHGLLNHVDLVRLIGSNWFFYIPELEPDLLMRRLTHIEDDDLGNVTSEIKIPNPEPHAKSQLIHGVAPWCLAYLLSGQSSKRAHFFFPPAYFPASALVT